MRGSLAADPVVRSTGRWIRLREAWETSIPGGSHLEPIQDDLLDDASVAWRQVRARPETTA
uniref:Uncharacterized protein n=1 Tax=Ralstonia solanacearum TaxID=305 RepID=A0A0S4TQW5_RALSL|nr:protein of unknown function [Ralstonia solanacearum]